ncbi:hypothetical protein KKA15_02985 [Patescibacteria group bacterium]|nr:hypothetical protein [Patescibacteria group bacterium]
MPEPQPGHEILSLLCPPVQPKTRFFSALTEKILAKGMFVSIVSAFLIVLGAAFCLRFASGAIEQKIVRNTVMASVEEKVGWMPGQYIAQETDVSAYIGK